MRTKLVSSLSISLLTAAVAAQYDGEGLGTVVAPATVPSLGASGLGNGVTEVGQILLIPYFDANNPDRYYLVATVKRAGGAGGWDAMTGVYVRSTQTFTKNNDVDALNTAGDEFAATVSADFRTFAMDTPSNAKWASRAGGPGTPFGALAAITGVPTSYIDTNFCDDNGALSLLFISGADLSVGTFSAGTVSSVRTIVTNPLGGGSHSPSPVNRTDGRMRSLIYSVQVPGRASNAWFTSALDDSAPHKEFLDTPTWLANPDSNGGTMTWAEAATLYTDPRQVGTVGMNSANVPVAGGFLNLSVFAPQRRAVDPPYVATVFISLANTAGSGIDLSPFGILGAKWSLGFTNPLLQLPTIPIDKESGAGSYAPIPAPANPAITLWAQPVLIDPAGRLYLGNTAYLEWR